ncbi:hypothetical protein SO802_012881 [Lithocarpus litseifolius]|uniref:Disease resistance protein At4g27190-like leucine-rich repeats domain-containing protein n=1 Tax=Lithocarpus litseifolius TaxID=425828 RepID=A0AAW2D804_9ROSI
MVQLKHFHVVECKVVEEIVLMENLGEEEITPKVLFPRLECLKLNDLPMLKRFCIGSNINFPSLTVLHIEKCPILKSFIASSGIMVRQEIKEMDIDDHTAMHPLFNEEVAFPSLGVLEISYMDNLQIIWPNDFAVDSFCKLEIMKVEFCEKLISIFQSNILTRFQSLETLTLTNCGLLQEVFELQGLDFKETHAVTTIQLKVLLLINLPKMKHVWNKDPQGFFSFQHLEVINAVGCHNLKSLFPASMAKSLMQLENLGIFDCGLEEIVAGEEGEKAIARFRFPQVTVLLLIDLPGLKWFYPGVHTSEWPMLREMCMFGCEKVETLASGLSSFQETLQEGQLNISIQQPFFLVEEAVFPNLETLRLMNNQSIKEIWHGKLLGECFCKLKVLEVIICSNKSFSLSSFLQKLDSLEKLVLINSFLEEIFTYEEILQLGKHARILTQLKELKLSQLPMLTHLWKEDIEPSSIFQNLETLELSQCGKLKALVPSAVSFQNLTNMEVSECHGLIYLVTSTAAKSLVQLKKLSVSGCKRIIEIVASEGGEVNDVINFCKLAYLKLENLPNLTNFCSGSYSFEFPSLEEVIVEQCPEMKIFSHGVKSTPKLQRVKTTDEDEWHGKLDLNTTVHLVWEYTMTMPFVQSNVYIMYFTHFQYKYFLASTKS